MATSYWGLVVGRMTEIIAATAGGVANAFKMAALDANGKWTLDMMPNGVGADSITAVASEVIQAGSWVNIASNGQIRNASAGNIGTRAHGYVNQTVALNGNATVYFDDSNTGGTGLTVGDQWLSTTAGQSTTTPPTGAGVISQRLGVAVSTTVVHANIQEPYILAQ